MSRRAGRVSELDRLSQLIDALDHAARLIRSGSSVAAAEEAAVAQCPDLGASPIGPNSPRHAARSNHDVFARHALRCASSVGGVPSAALESASATLRERRALVEERRAQAAQALLSARVLAGVPVAFAAWCVVSDPGVRSLYLSPVGVVICAVGGGLNALGGWWMRALIRGAT